jgi:hypothetical protein
MFVLCSSPSLDGGAPMSADGRPFRLEKKGDRRIGSKQTGVADAAGTKGWRPSVEIRFETRSGQGADVIFLQSARLCLAPTLCS